ncbi:hypothetical protein GCM10027346_19490 [Hymenobacter seoulensis]
MNILNLIAEIERVDPEVYERLDQRRHMFRHFAGFGKKLAVAAVPLALGSLFQKAYAQSGSLNEQIKYVLNFALGLEYLEYYYYQMGLDASGLLSRQQRTSVMTIRTDERHHVDFLKAVLGTAAIPDPGASAFDFTGSKGGKRAPLFADVFTNASTFLAVAQALEDTGVRAYKGGAPLLISNNTILEAALNIHSVEARHAAHIRTIRRGGPQAVPGSLNTNPKSWISGNDNGGPAPSATAPVYGAGNPAGAYPGEENVSQAGVNLVAAFGVTTGEASEAFDEPLDPNTVLTIASNFIK